MKKVLFSSVVAACLWQASALEISKVPEGKLCAFSFTYDDGVAAHYTQALPLHLKYGFPGTFLIITDRVEDDADANRPHKNVSWAEVKEMAEKGMEMASHTKTHRNMRELESAGLTREMTKGKKRDELFAMREPNWPTVWSEIELSKKALEEHTGQTVKTFAFAGNACPDWSSRICAEAKVCIRVGNIRIATGRGDTEEKYAKQLDEKVLKKDAFSCVMIHGVGVGSKDPGEGWNPIPSLEIYESLFKLVAERKDKIYVDTYGNNNAYASRAGKAKLKKSGENEFMLEWTGKDQPADSQIWLRVAPEESVTVNGTPAKPNEFGGLLVRFGDKISVASKEG